MDRVTIIVWAISLAVLIPFAQGQTCVIGEPPTDFCSQARIIPGVPGQHVVLMDASNAIGTSTTCGVATGKEVWFEVTPTVSGPMTISTCHSNTAYDTVLEVFSGGEPTCEFMSPAGCNDDTLTDDCENGCSSFGSTVVVNAVAGVQYRFVVGAFGNNMAGCALCLGVIVTIEPTCGDAPTNIGPCSAARELPFAPGTYEILQDVTDAVVLPTEPGPNPGCTSAPELFRTVWYHLLPDRDVVVEFNTCHSNTDFDTIVQVFSGAGLCAGGFSAVVACSDDFIDGTCVNSCHVNPRGSKVRFDATAGLDYWLQVGAFDLSCGGCLGANFSITDCSISDPPNVSITNPPELGSGCACAPVSIIGSVAGQTSHIQDYRLEYRGIGASAWNLIASGATSVVNGVLGEWDTASLAQGYYLLRISATNVCGEVSTDTIVTFLDQGFDTLIVRYPPLPTGAGVLPVVAGHVCVDGTVFESWCWHPNMTNAHFTVMYSPSTAGVFTPVDPSQPTYGATVVADPFASWDTIGLGVPDGAYDVRVTAENDCGQSRSETREVIVDNTPPTASISSVQNCDYIEGIVQIIGTAIDAHIAGWVLQYAGGNASGWVTIGSGSGDVVNDVLATWDTSNLPACAYALRLVVTDQAVIGCAGPLRHRSEHVVTVNVGLCRGFDSDHDGDVDLVDYGAFLSDYTGPLP